MISPDFFGCSGKLPFNQTRRLAVSARHEQTGGDFSSFLADGYVITSIDRVHRCAENWDRFARIALNHAFGDVVCAGAAPVQAMLSFEFGIDTPQEEYATCSEAFARDLARRGVALGKCHSGLSDGVTAVTIATLASKPSRLASNLQAGRIYLSRPIGALKVHYLSELGTEIDSNGVARLLEEPMDQQFRMAPWTLLTDVSGHGLLGAVAQVAIGHQIEVELDLSPIHAIAPEVLSLPVECLQNPLDTYGLSLGHLHPAAQTIATLRETAGPFLGFVEDNSVSDQASELLGLPIGRYRRGECKVAISWTE
jgi:hypothetical protein